MLFGERNTMTLRCLRYCILLPLLVTACRPAGPRPENTFADPKVIALVNAIERTDLADVKRLVGEGANVNLQGEDGITPLLWALRANNKAAFQALLECGADPNIQDDVGNSPISIGAGRKDDSEYLDIALKHGGNVNLINPVDDNTTPLFNAVRSRNKRNLDLVIRAGADLNHRDVFGETPAMDAALRNWFDSVFYLLEAGADHTIRTKRGLDLACRVVNSTVDRETDLGGWRVRVAAFLKKKGVDFAEVRQRSAKMNETADLPEQFPKARKSLKDGG